VHSLLSTVSDLVNVDKEVRRANLFQQILPKDRQVTRTPMVNNSERHLNDSAFKGDA
jgi:hypothetical protein